MKVKPYSLLIFFFVSQLAWSDFPTFEIKAIRGSGCRANAKILQEHQKNQLQLTFHSFDSKSVNKERTACNVVVAIRLPRKHSLRLQLNELRLAFLPNSSASAEKKDATLRLEGVTKLFFRYYLSGTVDLSRAFELKKVFNVGTGQSVPPILASLSEADQTLPHHESLSIPCSNSEGTNLVILTSVFHETGLPGGLGGYRVSFDSTDLLALKAATGASMTFSYRVENCK